MNSKHRYRIAELIIENYSDEEICNILNREFNLSCEKQQIQSKRNFSFLNDFYFDFINEHPEISRYVFYVFMKFPMLWFSAKDLVKIIKKEYLKDFTSKEINKSIYKYLKFAVSWNKDNYTYQLSSNMVKISITNIEQEIKGKKHMENKKHSTDIYEIPSNDDLKTCIFYPIVFENIPIVSELRNKYSSIRNEIHSITKKIKTNEIFNEENIDDIIKTPSSWRDEALIYWLMSKRQEAFGKLEKSQELNLLIRDLRNPYSAFFKLIETNVENVSFANDNPKFNSILNEVGRDNKITKKEADYILEKANEMLVDTDKVKLYLNNPFLGYETFKVFIDEICLDGKITEKEKAYIEEKAEAYNVPEDQLNKMLNAGLIRASITQDLNNNEVFYDLVLIYLIANSFSIIRVQELLLKTIKGRLSNLGNRVVELRDLLFDELMFGLVQKYAYFSKINDISNLFDVLLIDAPDIEFAKSVFLEGRNENPKSSSNNKSKIESSRINNTNFLVKYVNKPLIQLFYLTFDSSTGYSILNINEGHPLYDKESNELIVKLASSLYHTRNTMVSRSIDPFIERFHQNLNLIE